MKDGDNEGSPASAPALPDHYFELYKIAVDMADRISARRMLANSFFATINAGLVALLGRDSGSHYVAIAGVMLALAWWALLRSYRDLNDAKYKVILAMEERLPVKVFADEWGHLKRETVTLSVRPFTVRNWLTQYHELGSVERLVPVAFFAIYVFELVRTGK